MTANRPTEQQIRNRAYEIYLQRGCQPGQDKKDWLQAEKELARLPIHTFVQLQPSKPAKAELGKKKRFSLQ